MGKQMGREVPNVRMVLGHLAKAQVGVDTGNYTAAIFNMIMALVKLSMMGGDQFDLGIDRLESLVGEEISNGRS